MTAVNGRTSNGIQQKARPVENTPKQFRQQLQQQQQEAPDPTPPEPTEAPSLESESEAPAAPAAPAPGRVLTMPTSSLAEIKRAERERGKRLAAKAQDATARELGYASHDDMIAKLRAKKAAPAAPARVAPRAPAAPPEEAPSAARSSRTDARTQARLERAEQSRRAAIRARSVAEKKVRAQQRANEEMQAEHELRVAAVRGGVKDVDYALTVLKRKLQKLSPSELATFDEDQFFRTELRKTSPYLYEEVIEPATTSPSEPAKPTTPTSPKTPTEGKPADARTVSQQEYAEMLRKRGIQDPRLGAPS